MMKRLLLTPFLLFFMLHLFAQSPLPVKGVITDENGQPLTSALIFTIDDKHYTQTNAMGQFTLDHAEIGDTLVITYLGFERFTEVITADHFDHEHIFKLTEDTFNLTQVHVSNQVKNTSQLVDIDLKNNPVKSSQEILRKVPGLIIGQHAGGGKAEQIFLRGFDIDHGTDVSITVDGLPVNMVSHAHGQGYADLHFLIPETVESIDFGKGPYYADEGNFATAGYVNFRTKRKLDGSAVGLEIGRFNSQRTYGMFDILNNKNKRQNAYIAAEYISSDGPFESPQNFNRINLMGKYTVDMDNNQQIAFTASTFQSKWDASGQIPQRLVDDGTISRFGAVDDTEGGETSRTNLSLDFTKVISPNAFIKTQSYYTKYDFNLYSNFTFFLEDPLNGDQIRQKESRQIYGLRSTLFQQIDLGEHDLEIDYGLALRYDNVDGNQLAHTINRKTTNALISSGDVDETNLSGFINAKLTLGNWLINPGVRVDAFTFAYEDLIPVTYTRNSEHKTRVSPKLNIIYNPSRSWQIFLKSGVGFHSNDTRVVVAREGTSILPAAYGADLGGIFKPHPKLWLSGALWALYLQQEFVYVGDAGIVEPSGRTLRRGIDFGVRYQISKYLYLDGDINYSHARSLDDAEGENFIPLAPDLTSAGGIAYQHPSGFNFGTRYRYVKDRPANEDNSIVAKGYFLWDANVSYTIKNIRLMLEGENLLNQEWNEAQFATESRLQDEVESVEELHFTPGTPINIKASLRYSF